MATMHVKQGKVTKVLTGKRRLPKDVTKKQPEEAENVKKEKKK